MTGFTEQGMRAATHESAHAAAAILQGLRVELLTIDRRTAEGWGATHTSFRDEDPRTVLQKAEARAVVSLAAVLWEPGGDVRSSDGDLRNAYEMAEIAEAEDPNEWVAARSRVAEAMTKDARFVAVADALSLALLEENELDEERALRIALEAQLPDYD